MEALIPLIISLLPKQIQAISWLKNIPDAVGTVKELIGYVQRVTKVLKSPDIPLTPEQEAILDAAIDALKDDPYWSDPELDEK